MKVSDQSALIRFIKENLIGRVVVAAPITTAIENGKITSTYEEDVVYSNFRETSAGFMFDLTNLSRGTRYQQSFNGKDFVAEGSLNAVRVLRYDMTLRRSSGHFLGFARFISSTNPIDPMTGTVFRVRMWLSGDTLEIEEVMCGYADIESVSGGFRAIAIDGRYKYECIDGILTVSYQQSTFIVNTDTMGRVATGDVFPLQVSKEITFPSRLDPS
jgi:hypothetical protein